MQATCYKKKNKVGCIIDAYSYLITKPGSYFLSSGRLNEVVMSQKKQGWMHN